jgi:hypothetical protein
LPERRFPLPWSFEDKNDFSSIVCDHDGAYVQYEMADSIDQRNTF